MKKLLILLSLSSVVTFSFAQNGTNQQINGTLSPGTNSNQTIQKRYPAGTMMPVGTVVNVGSKQSDTTLLPISPNGKLISIDGHEVDFLVPSKPSINGICATPRPVVNGEGKNASCAFTVPCDDPSNRDVSSYSTMKYIQVVWHVMWDGGASSNIDQVRIDQLMAELNADYASHNVIFCATPASFYEDPANYDHNSATEEWQLKDLYNVTPADVVNIYVVGDMTAGGYARFPYDPNGGTDPHGGIVLNRGNCTVGTHTLAHEMGHTFGLEHTFAGVDERSECSNCYERVRNANGSPNTSGAATPLGGPYLNEGDREGDWCSDTNPHDTYSYNCSTSSNSNGACDIGPWANAPVNNHMSYSFCSSQFTAQQSRRMHCMLDSYLGSWTAYGGGLCGAQPPVADFVGTPTTWQAPANVNFTDLSAPQAIITGWTWTFDVGASASVTCAGCVGANATFVGQVPPTVTYPNPGLYTVSLTITSANGNDTETKIDYIEVLAPAGDCDTLYTQWETPTPTPSIYTFGAGYLTGVQDPLNSLLPTDLKGVYEMYFTPNPGVTQVGAVRVGMGFLADTDDDMVLQIVVFDDDGFGAPGATLGGVALSPTQLGVPGFGFYNEFWIPLNNAVVPTTGTFHVGVEMIPGDAADSMIVISSAAGQGEGDFSNHIWSSGYGYENLEAVYGIDFDLDIVPMLGEWAPLPLITGFTENVVCDTTYVTLFDTALYSSVASWSFTFADGTVINSVTDPMTIDRVYTSPGPDTVTVAVVNDCGRADTTTWIIPYGFLATPDAEFSASPVNPVCMGAPGVNFTADVTGYVDYTWDFGDGTAITSSGTSATTNHVYTTPGTYYVELTTTQAGYNAADTFYLQNFEAGWPVGYVRRNADAFIPNAGVNPPFTGSHATAWLPLDIDGDGDNESVSTSWNGGPGQLADDWMITSALGVLPANQRLFWDGEALDPTYADGYQVRISTVQLPATVANYATILYQTTAENAFSTTHSVDLSAYAGQTVYIAFRNNSNDMYLLSIDNIRVGTATPGCDASILKTDYVEVIDCSMTPPTTVLNSDVTGGCAPLTVNFTDGTTLGDPADEWLWNFGDGTFSTLQNPPPHIYTTAGSYYVIFESCNNGGCTQDTITIVVGSPAVISSVVDVNPTCAGNDGSITITATGGTGTLQYSIDNGVTFQASNVFTGLGAGTFNIVVEDAIGCQTTDVSVLVAGTGPTITMVTPVNPLCNGGTTGTITITASGGTGALQYSINNGVTFQAGNAFTGLAAGVYNIVVEDANGCQATQVATLVAPAAITITSATGNNPTCFGALDGSITILASGGTGALQYSVNNGVTFQAGTIFPGLGAGVYPIVVQDANGCQVTSSVTLTNPPAVLITGVVVVSPLCNGNTNGSITITASGGTGALQYSINNGVTFQAGNAFSGLGSGVYNIVVEDASGCQATQVATLVNPPIVTITTVTPVQPSCAASDGTITITASGGTGALQYSIDNGATFQAGNAFAGLAGGTYDIVVEDANGCQATSSIVLTPSAAPSITSVTGNDPMCSGALDGDITIVASGGTGALQYSIDNGVTFQAGGLFAGLAAGVYNIVVEDASGCQATSVFTLVDPTAISITTVTPVQPSCVASDGSITITAAGGTGALQYSIDNGATFQAGNAFTGLAGGTYNIVVEDANGCQATSSIVLTPSAAPSITSVTGNDPTCSGALDGDITIVASGGTGALQYSIDNGVTFQAGGLFTGLAAGVYNIVVEDASGCQATSVFTLVDPAIVSITSITPVDPACAGAADGTLTILASGGTGVLQYSVDGGVTFQASNAFTGLVAGVYNVVVEDANGCQTSQPITLVDPALVTYTATIIDENCGLSDGQIDLVGAAGAGAPFQYSIDGGATFQASGTFSGLVVGNYNVVVEDMNGCQVTGTETVNGAGGPTITGIVEDITLLCNGDCNGQLTASVTGGTLPYQFNWVDGAASPVGGNNATVSGLCADAYTLTVIDNGGAGCATVMNYTIVEPSAVTYTATITDETCGASNGQIDLTGAAGGSGAGYQYSIDNGVTFQAGTNFAGLTANTYNVVVTDGNGCAATSVEVLSNTAGATITLVTPTDPSCGASNGAINITAVGGTGALQYSIDNGVTFQAGNTFAGLTAGIYNIVVEDGAGCQTPSIITLVDAGAPTITSVTPTDPTCAGNNGMIDIVATGGTGALQYSIDNGVTFQVGTNFSGLSAGTYNIVVEDANGCQAFQTATLVNAGAPSITTVVSTDPTCGGTNGDITITATGGTGAIQYSIDNGVTFQAGNSFTGLTAGVYNIVIEDANGCQAFSIQTLVNQAGPSIVSAIGTNPTCGNPNGSITISISGGTGAIQYSIDNGVTFQAASVFNGLIAGVYNIVVEDANGCQSTSIVTLTDAGAPIITGVTPTNPTCGGTNGTIVITASGGTGALQYSVDNGVTFQASGNFSGLGAGLYNIVVQDANGCQAFQTATLVNSGAPTITSVVSNDPTCGAANGDIAITAAGGTGALQYSINNGVTFQAGNTFVGLGAGVYNIVVEDANGCQATSVETLVNVAGPTISSAIGTNPTCGNPNGTIVISATGGTGALQYSINNGVTFQASGTFNGLPSGVYNVVIQDANGCQTNTVVTLTDLGAPVISSVTPSNPSCGAINGSIVIVATGGTGALQYSINNGATFQASGTFTGLSGATYNIVVQDASGCSDNATIVLVDAGTPALTIISSSDPSCNNTNGTITLGAVGGAGGYQYSINGGATWTFSANFIGLGGGTYNLMVQDANGCQDVASVTLTQTGEPSINIDQVIDLVCFGNGNGQVLITVTGGTAPYTYDWSNDGTGDFDDPEDLTNGVPGVVSVTVVDANGCAELVTATIGGPGDLWASGTGNDATFGNDGSIDMTVGGGTPPYTYSWSNGSTVQDPTGLAGNTTYTLTVTDANGCTTTTSVFVGSVVGLSDLDNPMGVLVAPNPTNGELTVTLTNYTGSIRVDVVDIAGRLVYQGHRTLMNTGSVEIDLSREGAGVYFVNVSSESDVYSTRVIKQ